MSREDPDPPLYLSQHLDELRTMTIRILLVIAAATSVTLFFYQPLFTLLLAPLKEIGESIDRCTPPKLAIFSPSEGLALVFRTCFWIALVASSPLWLFIALKFSLPAIKPSIRKLLAWFLPVSLLFLLGGCLFGYCIVIPLTNLYLHTFNQTLGVNCWSLTHYVDYTVILLLVNGLAFESCSLFLFLIHYGIVTAEWLSAWRRHAWVAIFIISAVLTPPDVLTQLLMAIPLTAFYEIAILYGRFSSSSPKWEEDRCDLYVPDTPATPWQASQTPPRD